MKILQNAKMYKYRCYLSPGERKALVDLSHEESIIIKHADKSSSVVNINRCNFIRVVERQLKNDKYYEQLSKDPFENLAKLHKKSKELNLTLLVLRAGFEF